MSAMGLLYSKRISLDSVAKNPKLEGDAIKIEIENIITVSSNYPALGLFVIGLALVVAGLYYSNEEGVRNVKDLQDNLKRVQSQLSESKTKLATTTEALTKQRQRLRVSGVIAKEDHRSPVDIEVMPRWPIFRPDDGGHLNGLTVERDSDGRLPVLAFLHQNYEVQTVDLNAEPTVNDNEIQIPQGSVILRKLAGLGGTR